MSVLCPKCEKLNLCSCGACNKNNTKYGVIIELRDEELYQCFYCKSKFHPCESMDFEWDRMIKMFVEKASPELCYQWMSGTTLDGERIMRKELLDPLEIGEFGIQKAIEVHFGIFVGTNPTKEELENIRIQLIRDKKINQIL